MELRICEVDKGCGGGSERDEGGQAKRMALFPDGRGLGVGVRKRKIRFSLGKADEARGGGLD